MPDAPFTRAEYATIVRALHPDSSTSENRQAAFALFTGREILLRPEPSTASSSPRPQALPGDVAALLQRQRAAEQAERIKRAARKAARDAARKAP